MKWHLVTFDLCQPPLPRQLSAVKGRLDLDSQYPQEKLPVPKPVWDPWVVCHDEDEGVRYAAVYQTDLTQSHLNQNVLDLSTLKHKNPYYPWTRHRSNISQFICLFVFY